MLRQHQAAAAAAALPTPTSSDAKPDTPNPISNGHAAPGIGLGMRPVGLEGLALRETPTRRAGPAPPALPAGLEAEIFDEEEEV
jgi:hypothetical protein